MSWSLATNIYNCVRAFGQHVCIVIVSRFHLIYLIYFYNNKLDKN